MRPVSPEMQALLASILPNNGDLATELLGEAAGIAAERIAARLPKWWTCADVAIAFTILGEPASKANQRKLATVGKPEKRRTIFIKSDKARDYEREALQQIPLGMRLRLTGAVAATITIWYASERPDLDESIVLDIMQDRYRKDESGARVLLQAGVYRNDRQVREKHIFHGIDRANPRADIEIRPLIAQQAPLF